MNRSEPPSIEWSTTGILELDVASVPRGTRAAWLADALRRAVADGSLPVGAHLPTSRDLATELGVSRGLVVEAYRRLAEGGHVVGRGRGGTVVVHAPARTPPAASHGPRPVEFATPDLGVFEALRAASAQIDLTPGAPDLAGFPRAAWLRAERRVLDTVPPSAFGYADPAGSPVFRNAVAGWLSRFRGIAVRAEDVIVVAGFAQALALLTRVLPHHGVDRLAVEDPGSLGARLQVEAWGMPTVPVPVDERGLDVAALRATGARAVLVTPAHQYPTGVVLDGGRRRELAAWAASGGLIIEDDYDAEHRYDRAPVPAFQATAPDQVCYGGSLSKILAPALRVGWLVVPERLQRDVIDAKRSTDLGNATLPQLTLAELMDSGALEGHLRTVRTRHRRRRDAMIAALETHLPDTTVRGAAAGLHLTLTLDGVSVADTSIAEAALERGVKVQPLSWHRHAAGPPGLVVAYAAATPAEIGEGIAVLGEVVTAMTRRSDRGS
ncbi:PLP-dependent aminotransferase family protein [Nocardioides sp.]|uniref:MocR-like pyridoxine biosynthesis transcription factor PdxR n=1 Tax=Nocardioides sp. TaxID=35761 RepID=UPI002B652728|nr:PLP-dependent aminotransferase family protein [Nocardioides sp.]HXH79966.1 PLP-dependent aminotransferase family protein [Nocardioides sp.]